ncbi:ATP-binding protein [Streptomyces sp. NPDC046215]
MHAPHPRWQLHHLPPGHPSRAITLPATTRSAAAARRFSERLLAEWGLDELAGDTALLLSELVTNAVVHVPDASGGIELVLTRARGHLIAQVTDAGGRLPRCGRAGADSENGRGMWLVEALAARWGHHASGNGKTVWFTLPLPAPTA